ncbi:hypothetical protein AWW66_12685 [Micromonospora rosaria]|uniref:Mycothiol-dependent maleylpyruvate isomerase metal-binding domain-containing protein n=1 Tax=Micromonospora rosaria TaxID=47874 RepID=A0A136PT49_9ACTN|nr:maleylpyruvate isomerase N-terminal domain-containing protein [Micromonospora rosaria]KXK61618.1 hypothetical protein AWW66_12685 [Micromonospora rosaria]
MALRVECERLATELRGLDGPDLGRATDCPPWTVRDLVAHVHTGVGRLVDMLAAPPPERARVDATGYYGADKFAPEVDAERIDSAQRAARQPATGPELAGQILDAWRATDAAVARHPADRLVRTRHGDPMRLDDFLATRVTEVGVHGLDLAHALDRTPWLTQEAAVVVAGLLTEGRDLPAGLDWDRLTLIRKLTGRAPLTDAERSTLAGAGLRPPSFAAD